MNSLVKMKNLILFLSFLILFFTNSIFAQNIFSGEPVQIAGQMNSYSTASTSNSSYRRISISAGTPTDGRGQWVKTYNVQSSGGDFITRNMSGGGGNGFLFISGPSSNRFQNKWVFSGTSVAALNTINNVSAFNSGNDMGLNMSNAGRYTFVFNDCGYTATNAKFYIAYTQNAPVTVTRNSVTVNPDRSATIAISSSDSLSPTENIYVRYSTGANFASTGTSAIVQASPTNSPTNTTWNSYFTTSNNGSNFVRNRIANEFFGNEIIGSNFSLNDISNLFRYNENIGNDFRKNIIKSEVQSVDFSTATYVYSNYNCEVFENSSNNNRLSYYDGSDVLNIVNITD